MVAAAASGSSLSYTGSILLLLSISIADCRLLANSWRIDKATALLLTENGGRLLGRNRGVLLPD